MLTPNQITKLKSNWGDKADSMSCMAEVRIYDPLSSWECYIYAMNPNDEDEVCCFFKGFFINTSIWSLREIFSCYNSIGEKPTIDQEFRPRQLNELYKKLSQGTYER